MLNRLVSSPKALMLSINIILAILALFFVVTILHLTLLTPSFLVLVLALLITTKFRKCVIKIDNVKYYPFWLWLIIIFALQIGFYVIWFQTSNSLLLITDKYTPASTFLLSQVGIFIYNGLHPWGWVILLVIAFYCVTKKGKVGKASDFLGEYYKQKFNPTLLAVFDTAVTFASVTVIFLPFIILMPSLINAINSSIYLLPQQNMYIASTASYLICFIMFILFNLKSYKRLCMRNTFQHKSIAFILGQQLLTYLSVAILCLIVYSLFPTSWQSEILKPYKQFWIQILSVQQTWFLLQYMYLILCGPLLAGWIYRLSNGRSLISVGVSLLVIPCIITIALYLAISPNNYFLKYFDINSMQFGIFLTNIVMASYNLYLGLFWTILSLGLIISTVYFSRSLNLSIIEMTANEAGKNYKRLRLLFVKMGPAMIWAMICFLLGGIYALQFFVTMTGIAIIFLLVIPAIFIICRQLLTRS